MISDRKVLGAVSKPPQVASSRTEGVLKMRREVPTWLAVVVILVVLVVVLGFYLLRGRPTPQEPQAPFLKGQPGEKPVMPTK